MKILLSLRKKANSSHFIGFTFASSLYFVLGFYFFYSPRAEQISLKQEGNHHFTLSIQTLQDVSYHTQKKHKPTKQRKKSPAKPKPIPPTPKAMPLPQKNTPPPKQQEEIQDFAKESESISSSSTNPKQDTQNTQETLMHNEGVAHHFFSQIHSLISSHNPYPRIARRQRLEGEVIVEFILETTGKISEVKIIQSNAKEILQRSAIKALHKASEHFPHPNKRVKIRVPILYKLS